jgi:hypothetical protein
VANEFLDKSKGFPFLNYSSGMHIDVAILAEYFMNKYVGALKVVKPGIV